MKMSRSRCYDCCQSQLARNSPSFQVLTLQNIKKRVHRVLELVMQTQMHQQTTTWVVMGMIFFSFVQYFSQIIMVKKGQQFSYFDFTGIYFFTDFFIPCFNIPVFTTLVMYYMREIGLHNPLVCGACSDQDQPGVCGYGPQCPSSLLMSNQNTSKRLVLAWTPERVI